MIKNAGVPKIPVNWSMAVQAVSAVSSLIGIKNVKRENVHVKTKIFEYPVRVSGNPVMTSA